MEQKFWAHPTAIVDNGAEIGEGTKIWHFTHVCGTEVRIGRDCSLGQGVYVGPRVSIGNGCRIQNGVSVYDMVELEDYVFCGPAMVFTNVVNPRAHIPRKEEFKRTIVRSGVSLGANCTVVCGIEIGRFAFVAAGAVVVRDVPEFALMAGVPARRMGWMCHCGVSLKTESDDEIVCPSCSSAYLLKSGMLKATRLIGCFAKA